MLKRMFLLLCCFVTTFIKLYNDHPFSFKMQLEDSQRQLSERSQQLFLITKQAREDQLKCMVVYCFNVVLHLYINSVPHYILRYITQSTPNNSVCVSLSFYVQLTSLCNNVWRTVHDRRRNRNYCWIRYV